MNVKIIIALLFTIQLAAGVSADIGDALSNLGKQVADIEKNVVQNFQNMWMRAINETKQKLDTLKTQIQTQIDDAVSKINNITNSVSICVQDEKSNLQKLVNDAKGQVQRYGDQEWLLVKGLLSQLNATIAEAKNFIANTTQKMKDCSAKGFPASLGCSAALAPPALGQALTTATELTNLGVQAQNTFMNALADLQSSLQLVFTQATTQANALVSETIQCIKEKLN